MEWWFDFYLWLMLNEGTSATLIAKLLTIATGCVAAGICAGLVWIVSRAIKRK